MQHPQDDHTCIVERTTKRRIHSASRNIEYPFDIGLIEGVLRVERSDSTDARATRPVLHVGQLKLMMQRL